MRPFIRKLRRVLLDDDPSFCDMYHDAPSHQAAEEYLSYIRPVLRQYGGPGPLTMLDAGCQAGRFLIPFAQEGHRMIGLDTSRFALRRARRNAQMCHVEVRLHRGSIAALNTWIAPASLDVVLCLEVLYLCENYRELLGALAASVKPGGLLCVSHRPRLYYVARALHHGHPAQATEMVQRGEGPSPDGQYHNWHTPEELTRFYREQELQLLEAYPVGCQPTRLSLTSEVDDAVRDDLATVYTNDSTFSIPTYYLVIAKKPA